MTIDERLDMLERELGRTRRYRRFTNLAIVMTLAALALAGFVDPPSDSAVAQHPIGSDKVVRARMFVVEDENGRVLATLGLDDEGLYPLLRIFDENHEVLLHRAGLVVAGGGQGIMLTSLDGGDASLRFTKGGKTQLALVGVDSPVPSPEVRALTEKAWRDATEETRKSFPAFEPAPPVFKETEGHGLYIFEAGQGPGIVLGGEGRMRATLGVLDGKSALRVYDNEGRGRAIVGGAETNEPDGKSTRWPESSLLLFGPDGKLLWSAP